jgi:preprotein translocase subunit SecA
VIIVDEFTGRLMPGRRYSEGLHQAIEAKEGVKVQRESQTLATITFQNFFRMYKKLSGMTGTAVTEAEEFYKIYNLDTVVIPTYKPMVRKDMNDLIYRTEEGKFKAVIEETKKRNKIGQPVLIGTISIEKNEVFSEMMAREGLRPQILNAKNHEKEAQIIAEAGKCGAITIATNMAGRGVDVMLGGRELKKDDPQYKQWKAEHDKVVATGGLHVIGTERHESRRIDNQLRGRAGRQGDPGSSQFYVSTEDDLMRIFGGDRMKSIMGTLNLPEDMPIENKIISKSIESAQKKVEANNFDIRKHLVEYDDVLNKHREAIYRKRKDVLEKDKSSLADVILEMIEKEIEQVVSFHTAGEKISDWNLKEVREVVSTIFPVNDGIEKILEGFADSYSNKFDQVKARTIIIEYLITEARTQYEIMIKKAREAGFDWPGIEASILIRSIDLLWIEHLEAISSLRQGIGLRGYGQRDPLIEYKKEAFRLYNELNALIQKEVVYSIFKVGQVQKIIAPNLMQMAKDFSAPAKEMDKSSNSFSMFKQIGGNAGNRSGNLDLTKPKIKTSEGAKIGRNDPCPCGSGKKYKKCCGK